MILAWAKLAAGRCQPAGAGIMTKATMKWEVMAQVICTVRVEWHETHQIRSDEGKSMHVLGSSCGRQEGATAPPAAAIHPPSLPSPSFHPRYGPLLDISLQVLAHEARACPPSTLSAPWQ
jgi:hypothetical protein